MRRCPACAGHIRDPAALRCPYCGASLPEPVTATAAATATPARLDQLGYDATSLASLDGAGFAPGEIFAARYRIVSLIGRGAMGDVYRADDLKLGQAIALKLLVPSAPAVAESLAREVRLARGIGHPNVCRVYDIGETSEWRYLSMEYVDGETLASLHQRIGRLPAEKALDVARQLSSGLAAAHRQGVLHRDLKPSNIMLDGRGRVRILDFGLAVRADDERVHGVAGTPAYMAPEQLTGGAVTPQTDLYALGLVLYELFTGHRVFGAVSVHDRIVSAVDVRQLDFRDILDSRIRDSIRRCLADDPRERPSSALHVAAGLPGGDPIASALSEGRVPQPDMVAAAGGTGALRPVLGGLLLGGVAAACLLIAWGGARLTISPDAVRKPPEVLTERARDMLAAVGHSKAIDHAYWFERISGRESTLIRFVYRESPHHLVPQNFLHYVTSSDPPVDVTGMASVTLDASGALVGFSRVLDVPGPHTSASIDWSALFERAGLSEHDFVQVASTRRPLLPHDLVQAWGTRENPSVQITAAALGGIPVYFERANAGEPLPARNLLSSRRDAFGETLFWLSVMTVLAATALMARRNVRAGEGDLSGAWRLAMFVMVAGISSAMLRAHHVPSAIDELSVLLAVCGWTLLWAGVSWMAYVSFEPYVRRFWPWTLVSWTRVLRGYLRDPLVGRDVLVGVAGGVGITAAFLVRVYLTDEPAPLWHVGPALDSLRSTRHLASVAVWAILDGLQFALGAFFLLLLFRLALRRTWLAILTLVVLATALAVPSASPWAVVHGVVTAALFIAILMRVGLLAAVVTLMCERLLTRLPLTLDLEAWYFGSSLMVLLVIVGVAALGLVLALKGRSSFSVTVA